MSLVRSLLFNAAGFLWTCAMSVIALPLFFLPRRPLHRLAAVWAKVLFWMMRRIVGLSYELRGADSLPPPPYILAVKHQSTFETLVFHTFLDQPIFVLKRELLAVPVFGWYLAKSGMIGIDRSAGAGAMKKLLREAGTVLASGRQIIVFPEGTRAPPGEKRPYHAGIAALYKHFDVPVIPVALNSGLFWGRRAFVKKPGVITIRFLPPMPRGLDRAAFMRKLEARLEAATNALISAARDKT
jgi:1-acyl-sn-glycerol-3-phosphate acyltransferase